MYENVLVGVRDHESGLDAIALARELLSPGGLVTLLHVQGGQPTERGCELEALADLRSAASIDAAVVSVAAQSAADGLHAFARRHAHDLIVVGASRAGDLDRLLIGGDTRDVLRNPPCSVAVAPLWYAGWAAPLRDVRSADDMLVVEACEQGPAARFLPISTLGTLADRPVSPLLVRPRRGRASGLSAAAPAVR
jgi:nucleotide-binding universal stress UspA family protein